MSTNKRKIEELRPHVTLYVDDKTGLATVDNGTTGQTHSLHPNIDATGSVSGMKKQGFWNKDDVTVKSSGFIYNTSSFVAETDATINAALLKHCHCGGNHGQSQHVSTTPTPLSSKTTALSKMNEVEQHEWLLMKSKVTITDVGSENIYFKDNKGINYFVKPDGVELEAARDILYPNDKLEVESPLNTISLAQLKKEYFSKDDLTEITDRDEVRSLIKSKASATWGGGEIGDTGYTQLAIWSPAFEGDNKTIAVCKNTLLQDQFTDITDVIKETGLKPVVDYSLTQHGIPAYAQSNEEAFIDFTRQAQYGGMKLDEKIVEWANEGEIKTQYLSPSPTQAEGDTSPPAQLYKFQIKGYEESHPDTYMLGLGTVDDQNIFIGTLKSELSPRTLTKPANYSAGSDPYSAWNYANNGGYGSGTGDNYTVIVSALPITNITLVNGKENTLSDFPALSKAEKQELSDFTTAVKQAIPAAKSETLHQLCTIASDMQKLTIQNEKGILSNEKHTSLTDQQEVRVKELIKDLPGVKPVFNYNPSIPAIELKIPTEGHMSKRTAIIPIPEIPKNKLTIAPEPAKTATEIVSKKR